MSNTLSRIALAAAAGLTLAACGSSAGTASRAASAHTASTHASPSAAAAAATPSAKAAVQISNYAFHPGAITVRTGARVTFSNHDQTAHTATGSSGGFDTGTIAPGSSRTVVLKHPGTYAYYCQFHAFMRGTLIVK